MPDTRIITFAEAINEALDQSLAREPGVFLLGEGVADPKGIFGTTKGLLEKYGSERVIEMPVAENGLTGVAIGAALVGQRPVMVHQRVDFALLALEQIFNNAAKMHYVTFGAHRVPLVIRMIIGRGWGQGPQHSQSLEAIFAHVPGLKVVMPTTAYDAKGMLIAAIEDDNPVIFLEHRWLHGTFGPVSQDHYSVPLTGPRLVRQGEHVTVVATSYAVLDAMRAAEALTATGVEPEVIDLRVLRPLDLAPIVASVKKTGRLVFVDTGWKICGMGAEVVAAIAEACFGALLAPPARIGLADHPTPSSRSLIASFYPRPETIADEICRLLAVGDDTRADVEETLAHSLKDRLIDVPDRSFAGPF